MSDSNPHVNWINRLGKWRAVFAGWQLGRRPQCDPESEAVRDHRELSMLLRAELNALSALLLERKIVTVDDLSKQLQVECKYLCEAYERRFPGVKATDAGIQIQPELALHTTGEWMQ